MKGNNFKGACIYRIQHKIKPELLYIGSTINLSIRRCTHKNNCDNLNINSKLFQIIRSNGGWGEFNCEILIKVKCVNSIELRTKENEIIQALNPSMNSKNAINLLSSYDYHKKYRSANKEKIVNYRMKYRQLQKDKVNLTKELIKVFETETETESEPEPEPEPEPELNKMDIDNDDEFEDLYDVYNDVEFLENMKGDENLLINDFIRELLIDVIKRNRKKTH